MEYVNLGSTGLKVSPICLGCMSFGSKKWREWVLEEDESRTILKKAVEGGMETPETPEEAEKLRLKILEGGSDEKAEAEEPF